MEDENGWRSEVIKEEGGWGSVEPSEWEKRHCMEYTQHSACSEHGPPSRVEIRTRPD